jgi:hypothetical protein
MEIENTGYDIINFFKDSLSLPDFQLYRDEFATVPLNLSLTLL